MSHLSEREQNEYLMGERTPPAEAHLAACAECRAATARLQTGLALYRESAVSWAAVYTGRRPAPQPRRRGFVHGWAAGCAAAGLAAAVALVSVYPHARPAAATPGAAQVMSDDALLEQVDQQVSGNVPAAMQPLALPAQAVAR